VDSQTHDPIEGDTVPANGPDYEFHQIISKRNLEDFSRLWMNLAGLQDILTSTNSPLQIGLKWQSFTGTPAINIYPSADGTGSDSYLKDDDAAETQIADVFNNAVTDKNGRQTVDTTGTFIFKSDYWTGLTAANPKKCLLFEGAGEGTDQLTIVILDQNGNELGHGPGVWLDLRDIKEMYQRGIAAAQNATLPYNYTTTLSPANITLGTDPMHHRPSCNRLTKPRNALFSSMDSILHTRTQRTMLRQCSSGYGGAAIKDASLHSVGRPLAAVESWAQLARIMIVNTWLGIAESR
jgi:hypothetical protein